MSDLEIAARYAWAMLSTWPMKDARDKQHRDDIVLALERGLNINDRPRNSRPIRLRYAGHLAAA